MLGLRALGLRGIEKFSDSVHLMGRLLHMICQLRRVVEWLTVWSWDERSFVQFQVGGILGDFMIHCFFIHCGV